MEDGQKAVVPVIQRPKISGKQIYLLARAGASTTELSIGQPGIRSDDKDLIELDLANFILGDGMTSRLFEEIRNKTGWTYGVASSFESMDLLRRHGGVFNMYAFPRGEFTEKALLKMLEVYSDWRKDALEAAELKFAKNYFSNSYAFRFATAKLRLNEKLSNILDGTASYSVSAYRQKISRLTNEQLKKILSTHLSTDNLVIAMVGEESTIRAAAEKIPGEKRIVMVKDPMALEALE